VQNASGNQGDDFRALKLSELQPYTFLHPNKETLVQSILGLQGEEKAGAGHGMRTVRFNITSSHLVSEMQISENNAGLYCIHCPPST
jgi:hypothetical protein